MSGTIVNEARGGYWGFRGVPWTKYSAVKDTKLGKTFHVGKTYKFKLGFSDEYAKGKLIAIYLDPQGFGTPGKPMAVRLATEWVISGSKNGYWNGRHEKVEDVNISYRLG
jgi:hypothetical protein